ncbi:hypothetical protein FNL07_04500 [Staphylococcus haemolyticus]|nr:hypothetical protein FNL07_04500 [Staphylococcus haemolyticus]
MRGLLKGIIALLIILGVVKTFQDHDVMNEANYYYNQAKNGELVQNISNFDFNNYKDLNLENFKPSDFFLSKLYNYYNTIVVSSLGHK